MIRPAFSGPKNSGRRKRAGHDAHEAVHRLLVAVHRPDELLHLGRRGLDLRELVGELVDRQRLLVPRPLIVGHRIVVGAAPREGVVERGRHRLCVAEGVGDPERGDRVLVVAGVADERPARAEGLRKKPGRSAVPTKRVSRLAP
jgi:hypothetical protein